MFGLEFPEVVVYNEPIDETLHVHLERLQLGLRLGRAQHGGRLHRVLVLEDGAVAEVAALLQAVLDLAVTHFDRTADNENQPWLVAGGDDDVATGVVLGVELVAHDRQFMVGEAKHVLVDQVRHSIVEVLDLLAVVLHLIQDVDLEVGHGQPLEYAVGLGYDRGCAWAGLKQGEFAEVASTFVVTHPRSLVATILVDVIRTVYAETAGLAGVHNLELVADLALADDGLALEVLDALHGPDERVQPLEAEVARKIVVLEQAEQFVDDLRALVVRRRLVVQRQALDGLAEDGAVLHLLLLDGRGRFNH